ncbi:hypothetical protein Ancab_037194 [Ancistrocladus abbreviatus]
MKRVGTWPNFSYSPTFIHVTEEEDVHCHNSLCRRDLSSEGGSSISYSSAPPWSRSSPSSIHSMSPSPTCSSTNITPPGSPQSTTAPTTDFCNHSLSHVSSEFFTPRNQSASIPRTGNESDSRIERDFRAAIANAKKTEYKVESGEGGGKEECGSPKCESISTTYESAVATLDHYHNHHQYNHHQVVINGSAREELMMMKRKNAAAQSRKEEEEEDDDNGGEGEEEEEMMRLKETSNHQHIHSTNGDTATRMTRRPKPYPEFLDEVERQQIDAHIDAWKKSQYIKLQNKLREKEAEINDWETRQKNKAEEELKIVEKKLQKTLAKVAEAAENKKARERRSVVKKMAKVSQISEKMHTAKSMKCLKLMRLC